MTKKVYVKEGMGFEGISMREGKKNGKRFAAIIITSLIFVASLVLLGLKLTQHQQPVLQQKTAVDILPTSVQKELPTDTPAPTIDLSPTGKPSVTPTKKVTPTGTVVKGSPTGTIVGASLSIAVLNGSGEKGAAGNMKTVLTNAGYTVTRTGNADSFTYKGITVSIKKEKSKALDQLKKDLASQNYLITKTDTALAASETADAVVIVGAE